MKTNNTNRSTTFSSLLLSVAIAQTLACTAPTGDRIGTNSEALCGGGVCTIGGGTSPSPSVTLTSDELDSILGTVLSGSRLSVDTTASAPPDFGPPTTYPNPAYAQCAQDLAGCNSEPVGLRAWCRANVNKRCQGVPPTFIEAATEYSYLEFSQLAKSYGASDVFFPLQTIHHSGIVSWDIDINYVHATFGLNLSSGFNAGSVWLRLDGIQSNSPTIILSGSMPSFNFTNMVAGVTLDGLAPTSDGQKVDYASATSTFTFDWDATSVPDGLVSAIVDVNSLVQSRVTTSINSAFNAQKSHDALSKALTALVAQDIAKVNPNGYTSITGVVGAGDAIVVYFDPK
jgi:hypothetical protein